MKSNLVQGTYNKSPSLSPRPTFWPILFSILRNGGKQGPFGMREITCPDALWLLGQSHIQCSQASRPPFRHRQKYSLLVFLGLAEAIEQECLSFGNDYRRRVSLLSAAIVDVSVASEWYLQSSLVIYSTRQLPVGPASHQEGPPVIWSYLEHCAELWWGA